MFGPVDRYYVEGKEGDTFIQYSLRNAKLVKEDIQIAEPAVL